MGQDQLRMWAAILAGWISTMLQTLTRRRPGTTAGAVILPTTQKHHQQARKVKITDL